jgi:hypothetical protein
VLISEQLNDSIYSEKTTQDYIFMRTDRLPTTIDNLALNIPNTMLAAAELVKGTADSNFNNVFTLKNDDEVQSLKLSFTHLFGVEIDNIDLRNMRANTIYYPALPTQTASSDAGE